PAGGPIVGLLLFLAATAPPTAAWSLVLLGLVPAPPTRALLLLAFVLRVLLVHRTADHLLQIFLVIELEDIRNAMVFDVVEDFLLLLQLVRDRRVLAVECIGVIFGVGLGIALPLEGQVVAVVDVVDH